MLLLQKYKSSVSILTKKELNLMLKVSETSSQVAVGLSLRGTDFPISRELKHVLVYLMASPHLFFHFQSPILITLIQILC